MSEKIMQAIFEQGNFWCITQPMIDALGMRTSLMLMEHVFLSGQFRNSYTRTRKQLSERLGITGNTQIKAEDKLVKYKLIRRTISQNGGPNHYAIYETNVIKFVKDPEIYLKEYYIQQSKDNKKDPVGHSKTEGGTHAKTADLNNEQIVKMNKDCESSKASAIANADSGEKVGSKRRTLGVKLTSEDFKGMKKKKKRELAPHIQRKKLLPETIEIVTHWNSKGLSVHTLNTDSSLIGDQTLTIYDIDSMLRKVLRGTFYKGNKEIPPNMVSFVPTVNQIKIAIDRYATCMIDPNYLPIAKPKRVVFPTFFANPRAYLINDPDKKYSTKYPFIHHFSHAPVRAPNSVNVKDQYPELTNRLLVALYPNKRNGNVSKEIRNIVARTSIRIVQMVEGIPAKEKMETLRAVPELLVMALEERYKRIQVTDLTNGYFIESNFSKFLDRKGFKVKGDTR